MIYNLTMAVLLIFLCWIWGNTFIHLFDLQNSLYLFEVGIGYILMVIVLNLLYFRLDLNIYIIKMIVLVITIAAFIYTVKKFKKKSIHSFGYVFLFFMLSAGVAYLSRFRGFGESFYIFRGNVDDHFNYISMGYAVMQHPFSYYLNVSQEMLFRENDLLIQGAKLLVNDRASVSLPFALMLEEGKGSIFFSAYLYMSFLYAMLAPVLFYFYNKLIKNKSLVVKNLFLAGYLLGFWGQIHFDLNAWSQLGGIPIIYTVIRLVLLQLKNKGRKFCAGGISLILSIAAAFLVYPEAGMVYAAGMGVYLLVYYMTNKKEFHVKNILSWCILMFSAALLIVVINSNYRMIFAFMRGQFIGGITVKTDAWKMFDSYWVGRNVSDQAVINALNHILSFIGFYFLIPSDQKINIILLAGIEIAFISIIILGIGLHLTKYFKKNRNIEITELLWDCFFGYTVVLVLYLYIQKNYWVLGKLMIWMSPLIYYMFMFQVNLKQKFVKRCYAIFGGSLMVINLLFFLARIELSWNGTSRWYNNYPLQEGLRASAEWDLNMEKLDESEIIRIEDNYEGHYFHYLKQTIAFAGKEYYTSKNIIIPYGAGDDFGKMSLKVYDAFAYLKVDEDGKKKLNYALDLNGNLPEDVLYQSISFSPFDVLIREYDGFLEGDLYGAWTTEHMAKIKLLEPFINDKLKLIIDISGFARAESEEKGKTFHIKIGDERRTVILKEDGKRTVVFHDVKGLDEIIFETDKLVTPFDMEISEDKNTNFGVRMKGIQLLSGSLAE